MRCAVYARVSTGLDSQKDSLENQVSFFENFIKEKGWELVRIYADEGKSGTSIVKRKELQRLMRDAEQGGFDVVLIKSISRWARDTVDSLTLVRKLKSFGVTVISAKDGYNSSEDDGELRLTIFSMLAQSQSEDISTNVSFGIVEKSRKGVFHGTPPYGYDKIRGQLVPNPLHAPTVKLIFRLYLEEGWGMQKIANYLNAHNIPTPRSVLGAKNAGDKWHDTAVKIILKNPNYTGDLVQGVSKVDIKDKVCNQQRGYKKRIVLEEDKWIIVPNAHEALVTKEEFQAVQEKINKKAEKVFRGRGTKSLFARLAFCPDCGAGLNYMHDRKGYICATYKKNGSKKCSKHYIKHELLKERVLMDIRELASNSLNMKSLVQLALKRAGNKMASATDELQRILRELESLRREKNELLRLLTRQVIDQATYEDQFQFIDKDYKVLLQRKMELEDLLSKEKDTETSHSAFQREIQLFTQLEIPDEETLRQLLHKLIDKVYVYEDGRIEIHYNFRNPMLKGA
ncbi:recombinase family protein [Brevibacillus parabrevis]|uniref:Serine recombinase n=1 Tax=Brevibacillus parabrevis TaxID=54914 RepID=A0A4Y3PJN5_BREPA|nr:recombinase family protein [Brevibacillus parabrevis]RNB92944.1 recombinase family protein [Brevibacillus parabrevis]GEB32186.1 serine recombinase [Brevibacillus parabrevis]